MTELPENKAAKNMREVLDLLLDGYTPRQCSKVRALFERSIKLENSLGQAFAYRDAIDMYEKKLERERGKHERT